MFTNSHVLGGDVHEWQSPYRLPSQTAHYQQMRQRNGPESDENHDWFTFDSKSSSTESEHDDRPKRKYAGPEPLVDDEDPNFKRRKINEVHYDENSMNPMVDPLLHNLEEKKPELMNYQHPYPGGPIPQTLPIQPTYQLQQIPKVPYPLPPQHTHPHTPQHTQHPPQHSPQHPPQHTPQHTGYTMPTQSYNTMPHQINQINPPYIQQQVQAPPSFQYQDPNTHPVGYYQGPPLQTRNQRGAILKQSVPVPASVRAQPNQKRVRTQVDEEYIDGGKRATRSTTKRRDEWTDGNELRGSRDGNELRGSRDLDDEAPAKRTRLPASAVQIFRQWFFAHLEKPYPSEEEKEELARKTGLRLVQVNTWFTNARRRIVPRGPDANVSDVPLAG